MWRHLGVTFDVLFCQNNKNEILLNAPVEDADGNKAMVRYSRKTKEQYVMTEVDKKATGWRAYYSNGKWLEEQPKTKPKTKAKPKAKAKPRKKAS